MRGLLNHASDSLHADEFNDLVLEQTQRQRNIHIARRMNQVAFLALRRLVYPAGFPADRSSRFMGLPSLGAALLSPRSPLLERPIKDLLNCG
jgi:hypothetical protein